MDNQKLYWIEVDFANGKTLRKESLNLNETYSVLNRYNDAYKRNPKPLQIRAGSHTLQTGTWNIHRCV